MGEPKARRAFGASAGTASSLSEEATGLGAQGGLRCLP